MSKETTYHVLIEKVMQDSWADVPYHWKVSTVTAHFGDGSPKLDRISGGYRYTLRGAKKKAIRAVFGHAKQVAGLGIVIELSGSPEQIKAKL